MHTLWEDLRFGLRMLRSHGGFTMVAVLTLGLGIAANSTVFTWIDSVVLNPQPGAGHPEGLFTLETVTSTGEVLGNFSYTDYRDFRDNLPVFDQLAVARHTPLSIGGTGETGQIWGELVSANYFDVLELKPVLGRWFRPEEAGDLAGVAPVAVISHALWMQRFGGDRGVVGKQLTLNLRTFTIVGVAPADFPGSTPGLQYAIWAPISMAKQLGTGGGTLGFRGTRDITSVLARLRPDVTLPQAQAEADRYSRDLGRIHPETNQGIHARLLPLAEGHRGAQGLLRKPLQILMAVCALLFLIVCANVANLLLVRFLARRQELGIRLSLGAPQRRLLRQMLTETLLLAVGGALVGLLLTNWLTASLAALLPFNDIPLRLSPPPSWGTVLFAAAAASAATLLCGLAPALLALRQSLMLSLKEGGRGGSGGISVGRVRSAIVVAEVALATVALVGTGLFQQSFRNATAIRPGFETEKILVGQFYLSPLGYSAKQQREYCRELKRRLESKPGIAAVTYTDVVPLGLGPSPWHQIYVDGYTESPGEDMNIHRSFVAPGYFELMGLRILEGRSFTEADSAGAPDVMIVNETFARRFFGNANPIGRTVRSENNVRTVVGVVKDAKYHAPMEAPLAFFYRPFQQEFAPGLNFAFLVKVSGEGPDAFQTFQREARAVDANARVYQAMWLNEAIRGSLYPQKVAASLLTVLGTLSLFLVALGLFGVMSYAVSQRTREFAIRMALGARAADVILVVSPQALRLLIPGVCLGLAMAYFASVGVESMLVGVAPSDARVLAIVSAGLVAVGLLATLLPCWRAIRINPSDSLRAE